MLDVQIGTAVRFEGDVFYAVDAYPSASGITLTLRDAEGRVRVVKGDNNDLMEIL